MIGNSFSGNSLPAFLNSKYQLFSSVVKLKSWVECNIIEWRIDVVIHKVFSCDSLCKEKIIIFNLSSSQMSGKIRYFQKYSKYKNKYIQFFEAFSSRWYSENYLPVGVALLFCFVTNRKYITPFKQRSWNYMNLKSQIISSQFSLNYLVPNPNKICIRIRQTEREIFHYLEFPICASCIIHLDEMNGYSKFYSNLMLILEVQVATSVFGHTYRQETKVV